MTHDTKEDAGRWRLSAFIDVITASTVSGLMGGCDGRPCFFRVRSSSQRVSDTVASSPFVTISNEALQGSALDFAFPRDTNLLERCDAFHEWQNVRAQSGTWPFGRATESRPTSKCYVRDYSGWNMNGLNFASQDYLSLSSHPEIVAAAKDAIDEYGVHSSGSSALVGNSSKSLALERNIADFVQVDEALLFPTGWAAGFSGIKGLVRAYDHVVMDRLSHACLQVGAQSATRSVVCFRHLDINHCRQRLANIRARDSKGGIILVTESLFSIDSDTPDIQAMQEIAKEFDATLVVDVAHDLGSLGGDGTGHIGLQRMLGKVDLVIGSFSKTFGSNGGFIATKNAAVKEYLRFFSPPCTFSAALSPIQIAVISKSLDIVRSAEGSRLRRKLMANIEFLRAQIQQRGMDVYGDPSPIVSVKTGCESLARMMSRELPNLGLIANLVEFPAVAKGKARFRLQVMADHSEEEIVLAADILQRASELAKDHIGLYSGDPC
eukprot:CAMPEP_0184687390 /NCGR_PEP_ID=MMETSP0312-20130426/26140_1 /TAXON_ID=31354 /ORGANISM="Compsopogon coeruleus, Strain SAG 36.94" /LENGTH=492 /DNA_ID=CAMNT_0027143451 /DNA_START=131 /DNA_END=1612 /DNA_ORIENTATION=+